MHLSNHQRRVADLRGQIHRISSHLTRRRLLTAGLSTWALGTVGCSSIGDHDSPGTHARSIEHAFGSTQVPEDPERVLALGYTDVEVLLSLGIVPVGFTDFIGTGLNDWARPLAGKKSPESWELTDGVPLEKVIALEPDLVIASDALDKSSYDRLNAAVPTVGPFEKNAAFGTPWRDHTRRTAKAVNRVDRGEKVISELEERYAEAQARYSAFRDTTLTYTWPIAPEYYVYGASDPRVQVFLELGFVLTEAVEDLDRDESKASEAGIVLSAERLHLLDADLIVAKSYGDERDDVERRDLFGNIPAVKEGNLLWLPERISDGLAFGTALSTSAVLDDLVALISKTVE